MHKDCGQIGEIPGCLKICKPSHDLHPEGSGFSFSHDGDRGKGEEGRAGGYKEMSSILADQ